jgi:hypothetical protein
VVRPDPALDEGADAARAAAGPLATPARASNCLASTRFKAWLTSSGGTFVPFKVTTNRFAITTVEVTLLDSGSHC